MTQYEKKSIIMGLQLVNSLRKEIMMTQHEKDLEAVKHNGYALSFVKNQTLELCLEVIKRSGRALYCVENQTPEICLAAVKQDGLALHYVKNQTPELCLAAVRQNPSSAKYIEIELTNDLLRYLIENQIKFDLRKLPKDIPNDLKLLLVFNYGMMASDF